MASPPNLRAPQLTPIPEHTQHLPVSHFNTHHLAPSDAKMAVNWTPPPGLPLSYYDPPDHAHAIFSTCLGSRPKRKLVEPYPPVVTRTNSTADIQRKCQDLWKRFPDQVRNIKSLRSDHDAWYKLYAYFDGYDLWVDGAVFCYSVIDRLAEMNDEIVSEICAQMHDFAVSWVERNSKRLLQASENVDVMGMLSLEECEEEEFNLMTQNEIEFLREQLNWARDRLLEERRAALQSAAIYNGPIRPTQCHGGQPQNLQYIQGPQGLPHQRREDSVRSELEQSVPRATQSYVNFMESQRHLHGRIDNTTRDSRRRGWSNEGGRGRGNTRYNSFEQNTSPQRNEPVYVLAQRGASADMGTMPMIHPNLPSRPRTFSAAINGFSNDARNYSPHSRRTVSEQTNHRSFSSYANGERSYGRHSRVVSGTSASAGNSYQSMHRTHHSDGYEGAVIRTSLQLDEDLGIQDYEYSIFPNGSVTIFYSGPRRKVEPQPTRSVYVSGVPFDLFKSHMLREMMRECGAVDTISHLRNRLDSAFVLFHDESGVQRAIDRWNGCEILPGIRLTVNIQRQRGYSVSSNNRENGYDRAPLRGYSSQRPYSHNRTISANMHDEPYRPVIPGVLTDRRNQGNFALLNDIHNMSPNKAALQKAAGSAFFLPTSAGSSPKKENSPLATPQKSQNQTPKSRKPYNPNRKNSQQNSVQPTPSGSPLRSRPQRNLTADFASLATHKGLVSCGSENAMSRELAIEQITFTPVIATEHKSAPLPESSGLTKHEQRNKNATVCTEVAEEPAKPVPDVDRLLRENQQSSANTPPITSVQQVLPENKQPSEHAPKKSKGKSKKKSTKNAIATSVSTSSFDTIISPVSNENGSFMGSQSTNTSFCTNSSRQPSITGTKSRKAKDLNDKAEVGAEVLEILEKKTETDAKQESTKAKNKNRKPSKGTNTPGESGQQVAELHHSKKGSTSSLASNHSLRKTNSVAKKTEPQQTTSPTLPLAADKEFKKEDHRSNPLLAHAANDAKKVAAPQHTPAETPSPAMIGKKSSSERPPPLVVPSLAADIIQKEAPVSAKSPSQAQSPKSITESLKSPKQLDDQEWPSLGPIKSPVAAIADGKPPTPLRAPLMGSLAKTVNENSPEVKKTSKSTFPLVAVPRSFQSSRSPS